MNVAIWADLTGWFETGIPKKIRRQWESVSTERLTIEIRPLPFDFPGSSEISPIRIFFRNALRKHHSAIISCDGTVLGGFPATRLTFKSKAAVGAAMHYTSELLVRHGNRLLAVSVSCLELGLTGVREADRLADLVRSATVEQKARMEKGLLPLEWKHERYEPGTQGDLAYLVCDDEKYDVLYPWHPLTIVRRRIRWLERSLEIKANEQPQSSSDLLGERKAGLLSRFVQNLGRKKQGVRLNLGAETDELSVQPARTPIHEQEFLTQELGEDIANDLGSDPNTPLTVRQQAYRNRVLREQQEVLKSHGNSKITAESHHHLAGPALKQVIEQITKEAPTLAVKTSLDGEKCWSYKVPQHGWLALKTNDETFALPIFSSLALAEYFAAHRRIAVKFVELSARELWTALPEIRNGRTHFLPNPCPHCLQSPALVFALSQFDSDKKILEFLVATSAILQARSKHAIDAVHDKKNSKDRLHALCNFVAHVDPGHPEALFDMVDLGFQQRNDPVTRDGAQRIFKYAPSYLPRLAALLFAEPEVISTDGPTRQIIQAGVLTMIWVLADSQDQYARAVTFYEECIAVKSDHCLAHEFLGNALWYSGQVDRAIDVYSRALLLNPNKGSLLSSRGQVYVEAGEYEKALADLDLALQHAAPGNVLQEETKASVRALPLSGKGAALSGLGQFDLAWKCFNESMTLCPQNAWLYFNMASACEKQGDFEGAVKNYSIALKMTGPKLNPLKRTAALARLAFLDPNNFNKQTS